MKSFQFILGIVLILSLSACATDSQNQYSQADVGKEVEVQFGKIVQVRDVKVQAPNTGIGAGAGGAAGLAAGSAIGNGSGQGAAMIGGMLIGAIGGAIAEQQLQNRKGIEYTITKRNGKTVTIVQNIAKDDTPLKRGERVMIQTSGQYMRVLPAEQLPTEIKRPKDIKVVE